VTEMEERPSDEREERPAPPSAAETPFAFPDFGTLLDAAAVPIVDGLDRDAFVAWFVAEAPGLAPELGVALRDAEPDNLLAAFGRRLWSTLPRPDNRYRATRPSPPARNDECPCGSGQKYKRCCLALDAAVNLPPRLLLVPVLDLCADEALDGLDGWTMEADGLLDALVYWIDTGRGERTVRLAAPMFGAGRRPRGKLPRHAPDVLEVLLGGWPAGFRTATLDELLTRYGRHRDETVAAIAIAADIRRRFERGEGREVWVALRSARRRFPDDLGLVELEIDRLNADGRYEASATLAREWHDRLIENDPEDRHVAEALLDRAANIDPELALEQACAEDPVLDRLVMLLHETPPGPIAGTHARHRTGGELLLTPTPALDEVESGWHALTESVTELSATPSPDIDLDPDADPLTRLVSFLDDEPLALSSFAVLESLAITLTQDGQEPWVDALFVRILLRSERLLYRHVSRERGFETRDGLPAWQAMVWETAPRSRRVHPENVAALGLLAALADWYADTHDEGDPGDRLAAIEAALLGLDPPDAVGEPSDQ